MQIQNPIFFAVRRNQYVTHVWNNDTITERKRKIHTLQKWEKSQSEKDFIELTGKTFNEVDSMTRKELSDFDALQQKNAVDIRPRVSKIRA